MRMELLNDTDTDAFGLRAIAEEEGRRRLLPLKNKSKISLEYL